MNSAYKDDSRWQRALETYLEPGPGDSTVRLMRSMAAVCTMYAVERQHERAGAST